MPSPAFEKNLTIVLNTTVISVVVTNATNATKPVVVGIELTIKCMGQSK